ncbi:flagellar protein FlgN [Shouchella shacheensis]|uniref:flagellar protein FlgN n=1 Tax=Shouchella shacheensis TaxID=1649580 RepID=UPI00073FB5AC|nr:flagellar protein FlgN [Shouchella shacheensis]
MKETLDQLTQIHEELLSSAYEKQNSLLQQDMAALDTTTRQETSLVAKVRFFEKQLKARLESITMGANRTFSEWLATSDDPDNTELQEAHEKLRATIEKVKQVNGVNQQLIQDSLSYVQASLQVLRPSEEDTRYTKKASHLDKGTSQGRSIFDSKA